MLQVEIIAERWNVPYGLSAKSIFALNIIGVVSSGDLILLVHVKIALHIVYDAESAFQF